MLRVEVHHDGHGKYEPIVTVNLWDFPLVARAWLLYGSPVWVSPVTLRFYPIRFKSAQLPDNWPKSDAVRYFALVTLSELGLNPDGSHIT